MGTENDTYKILILDLVGLKFDEHGKPDPSEVKAHIESKGGTFHFGAWQNGREVSQNKLNFYYEPELSTAAEILAITDQGQYDAVIAAATFIPAGAVFKSGGVRIGAGTGNMGSASWGGGSGVGGVAPLMNTPSFNSRATAQMVFKALLSVRPDLPVAEMHDRVIAGDFDTGRDLRKFPTEKLEGKTFAIIGYGNIGREVARLAAAFYMRVVVYARPRLKAQIEADGFQFAETVVAAAQGADVISPHIGLGAFDVGSVRYANAGLISAEVLNVLHKNAVLINYDRGELVDAAALDMALQTGQLGFAAIDADLFVDQVSLELTGPMVPYLPLAQKYSGRLQLLPHAAADTDHPSRVAGAKQAVDQIFDAIISKRVVNLKGDLPSEYENAGLKTINC